MSKRRMADDDSAYDMMVDDIICSDDFENCKHKDKDSNCKLYKPLSGAVHCLTCRCWHMKDCPMGFRRGR